MSLLIVRKCPRYHGGCREISRIEYVMDWIEPLKSFIWVLFFSLCVCLHDKSIDKICIWHWAPAARALETDITVIKTPIYHLIWLPISWVNLVTYFMSLLGSHHDIAFHASDCEMERRIVYLTSLLTSPTTRRVLSHQGCGTPGTETIMFCTGRFIFEGAPEMLM